MSEPAAPRETEATEEDRTVTTEPPGAATAPSGGRMAALDPALVRWGADGLVPAIVVDPVDGAVLMLAWMDAEALRATMASGDVHFHSRSRGTLWRKGETSGNVLRSRSLALDCDGDALLVTAEPLGPTCHRGTRTCFDPDPGDAPPTSMTTGRSGREGEGFAWLEELWSTIRRRADERPAGSYTAALLDAGVDAAGRKVTEEATEVLIAAKDDAAAAEGAAADAAPADAALASRRSRDATRAALAAESADLIYHLLVLLAERDLPPGDVLRVLRERHSGEGESAPE